MNCVLFAYSDDVFQQVLLHNIELNACGHMYYQWIWKSLSLL